MTERSRAMIIKLTIRSGRGPPLKATLWILLLPIW